MTVYFDRTKGAAQDDAVDDLKKEIKNKISENLVNNF